MWNMISNSMTGGSGLDYPRSSGQAGSSGSNRSGAVAIVDSEASGSTTTASPPSPGALGGSVQSQSQSGGSQVTGTSGERKRKKWSAAERAEHSSIEKRRREEFNVALLGLARRLPATSNTKRINKRTVVQSAVEHVDAERKLVLDALPDLKTLVAERDDLLREVNEWRLSAGLAQRSKTVDVASHLEKLNQVESYAFNAFVNGFEGNEDDGPEREDRSTGSRAKPPPVKRVRSSISEFSPTASAAILPIAPATSISSTLDHLSDTLPQNPSTSIAPAPASLDMAEFFRSPAFQEAAMNHFITSSAGRDSPSLSTTQIQLGQQHPPQPPQYGYAPYLPNHVQASSPESHLSPMSAFLQAYTRPE